MNKKIYYINNSNLFINDNRRNKMVRFKIFEKDMYAILKHYDLTKRSGERIPAFMKKFRDKEEFLTKKGSVILKPPPPDRKEFEKSDFSKDFNTNKGKVKYPSQFFKTPDLGGKGVGSGTVAEDRELAGLQKEIEKRMAIDKSGVLNMIVGGRKVIVTGVQSTAGTPKSDFHLVDDKGQPTAWISHKDWKGRGARDFQQYGGLSHQMYRDHPEVKSFMHATASHYPEGFKRGDRCMRPVKDKKIALTAVWGIDYGKARGKNNVDEFHQGPMKLKKVGADAYKIISKHYDVNGKVPKGDYTCIFYARYTGDRAARIAGVTIKDARIGIFTKALPPKGTKVV